MTDTTGHGTTGQPHDEAQSAPPLGFIINLHERRKPWWHLTKSWWYHCCPCDTTEGPFDDQDAAIRDIGGHVRRRHQSAPAEHCGELMPSIIGPERNECALRPGHSGSHADEHGTRWWLAPAAGTPERPSDGHTAALAAWLTEQRDRAAACAHTRPLTADPTPGELAWMHEGARSAYDDVLEALQRDEAATLATAPDRHVAQAHAASAPNPPGSTFEQMPAEILELLDGYLSPYQSTACQTAAACERAYPDNTHWIGLLQRAEMLHQRCRRNHKFTGQPCICACHQPPADTTTKD